MNAQQNNATTAVTVTEEDARPNPSASKEQTAPLGLSGQVAFVHKQGEEGGLEIDKFSGQVLPNQENKPEWAEGLAMAQLAERHRFYTDRLGPSYTEDMKNPDVYAFEDLGWLAVNTETAEELALDADDEHRMDVIATVLGIDRETGDVEGALAEAEIAADDTRSDAEMEDFRQGQEEAAKQAYGGE